MTPQDDMPPRDSIDAEQPAGAGCAPTPGSAVVTRTQVEEIEIECPMECKDWALAQVTPEEGWNVLTIGPKRISLMEFDTSRLYLKAQRYLPNDYSPKTTQDNCAL